MKNRSVDGNTENASVTEQFFRFLLPAWHLSVTSSSQSEGDFTDLGQLLVISLSFLLAKTPNTKVHNSRRHTKLFNDKSKRSPPPKKKKKEKF